MNKAKLQNIFGLCFVLIFVIGVGFCAKESQSDPLKTLDEFHGKGEQTPVTKPEIKVVKKSELPENKPQNPAPTLNSFHGVVEETPLQSEVMPKDTTIEEKRVEATIAQDLKLPFFIGHVPESAHSVRVLANNGEYWANINAQLVSGEYNDIEILKSYVSGVKILDPKLDIGAFLKFYPIDSEGHAFYIGLSSGLRKDGHGLYFKGVVYSDNYKDLLESTKGLVAAYYYYNVRSLFLDYDSASFYGGWVSPPVKVNFSDMEGFKANFKDLKQHSENVMVGVNYSHNSESSLSYNIEASLTIYSIAVNFSF